MANDLMIPHGAGGGGSKKGSGTTTPNPIVADDTERTVSSVTLVDIISEGPILGLVNGAQSIYFSNQQWQLPSGNFNLNGITAHFRHGTAEQEPLPYKWIEQTFDVNQQIKSSSNHIGFASPKMDIGPSVDTSQGILISNAVSGVGYPGVVDAIHLGDPGNGSTSGYNEDTSGIVTVGAIGAFFSEIARTAGLSITGNSAGQTAVPTSAPTASIDFNSTTGHYEAFITNPGANVIGDGNTTRFQTYYYNGGWQLGPLAEINGGYAKTVTNPYARAARIVIKIDKLYQESGNGDIQPAVLRFVIQYKLSSDDHWITCKLLNKNWQAFTAYYDVSLPMAQPRAPTGWNWHSILGLLGPTFNVGGFKVNVAVRVPPRSLYSVRLQSKILDWDGIADGAPDPRAPDEGWVNLDDTASSDPLYNQVQTGYNGSDSSQVMRVTLYYLNSFNVASYALRVIDDGGNDVFDLAYLWTPGGPTYTDYGNNAISVNDGVQGVYANTRSGMQLDYVMELPPRPALGNGQTLDTVQIRVMRLTPDDVYTDIDAPSAMTKQGIDVSDTEFRANHWIRFSSLTWAAYVELIENTIQYADTAVCGLEFNSQWTGQSVPARAYDIYGRIIRIPSNYDAFAHTYTGLWDGGFVLSWSNNPVWVFLDLLTHTRYGLGQWIKDDTIDFAAMYQVAQYCDEMVQTDGDTSPSPRFTFNTQIVTQDQAYNVLAMLSSVFRGMVYWAAGGITVTQDSPKDPTRIVTPANVIGGDFQYVGSALQARHSVVIVQWSDPDNFGKDRTDVWEDPELIDRYGYVTTTMKAWGCTSFSQAMRMARWLLETEKHATEVVTYRAGFDHADARPGEAIAIADPMISGIRLGGRIVSGTTLQIFLDAEFDFDPTETYTLTIPIPTWGKVSITNGATTFIGTNTSFLYMGGDVIVLEGQAEQYEVVATNNTTFELVSGIYNGPTVNNVDFTILRSTFGGQPVRFVRDSRIPIVEMPVVNPGGRTNVISLSSPLPLIPNENVSFVITGQSAEPRLFSIVGNKEIDTHTYEISALAYDPTKFDRVEAA